MKAQDNVAFGLMLDSLAEIFNTDVSASRKLAYWAALKDVPLDTLKAACIMAMRTETFFPVPATLRQLAGMDAHPLPAAEAAWLRLRNRTTRYNREALNDPITREVFEAMGGAYVLEWGFGNWETHEEERKRREFLSRYHEAENAQALAVGQRRHGVGSLAEGS
jgi:hypothetical protein